MIINGNEITDEYEISNSMNDYFCSVGQNIANGLNRSSTNFQQYLKNRISETFYLKPVIEHDVLKQIEKIKIKKSAGPDNIPNKLIKKSKYNLIKPLSIIYNNIFTSAKYPDKWKLAKVIALYKKGKHFLPEK